MKITIVEDLDDFSRDIIKFAINEYPKESKAFLRREARKAATLTKKTAKKTLNIKTGNYLKGVKYSKVYNYDYGDTLAAKIFAGDPAYHAHLIEYGHKIKGGSKSTRAFGIFDKTSKDYTSIFERNTKDFVKQVFEKI